MKLIVCKRCIALIMNHYQNEKNGGNTLTIQIPGGKSLNDVLVQLIPQIETDVSVDIQGMISSTIMEQMFINNSDKPIEATYVFPLNHHSAIYDMSFKIDDRVISSVIEEKLEAQKKYIEADNELTYLINFLEKNLEDDDRTGIGTLAAAYANRGIIKDRNKNYEEALKDYVKALGIDHEAVAGPGLGTVILNYKFKSSSVKERALYLNEQLQLPEDERVLSIEELDKGQVMHKPGKL